MHKHIKPAVAFDDRANRAGNRGGFRQVRGKRDKICGRKIFLRDAAIRADNRHASRQKSLSHKRAQPSPRSGDKNYSLAHKSTPRLTKLVTIQQTGYRLKGQKSRKHLVSSRV